MRHATLFLVVLLAGCGRGGFGPVSVLNSDASLDGLVITITEPQPGALVPRETTLRGTCSTDARLRLTATGDITPVTFDGCESGTFSTVIVFNDGDGVRTVTIAASGQSGTTVSDSRAFRRTTGAPVLTLDTATDGVLQLFTNGDTVSVTGTCESDLPVVVSGAADNEVDCTDGIWSFTPPAVTSDSDTIFAFTQTDAGGNTTSVQLDWVRDTQSPVIDSIVLNGGVNRASGNVLPLAITAHDVGGSGVATYRVGFASDLSTVAFLPTIPRTVTFPLVSGSYTVHAQVQDRAGNASSVGESGVMSLSIGAPPQVDVIAPVVTQALVTNATFTVSWRITTPSGNALTANPVNLYATTDDGLTTTLFAGGAGLPNSGVDCASGATGCVPLTTPSTLNGLPFRVVVTATDEIGGIGAASSLPFNGPTGLTLVAGRNAKAVGQSALTTAFTTRGAVARDPNTGDIFVLTAGGNVIYRVEATTGVMRLWAGRPGIISPSAGPRDAIRFTALGRRSSNSGAIAVDHASNVYIVTANGITKCVGATCTIIVGKTTAGGSKASGTSALSFDWTDIRYAAIDLGQDDRLYFFVTPNTCYTLPVYRNCGLAFRLEDNNTVTALAGTSDLNAPAPSGASHAAFSVRVSDFTVVESPAGDRLIAGGYAINESLQPFYELKSDGTLYRVGNFVGTQLYPYDPARKLVPYANGNTLKFFDPDAPGTVYPAMPVTETGASSAPLDLAGDEYGGMYATADRLNRVLYWPVGATSYDGFAGAPVESPDGAAAASADLRGIRQIVYGADGSTYFHSLLSRKVKKLDTSGTLSTLPVGSSSISSGDGQPLFTDFTVGGPLRDATGACVYYCAGTVTSESLLNPYATGPVANIGTTMQNHAVLRALASRSANTVYTTNVVQVTGGYTNAIINGITNNNVTLVAGNPSLQNVPSSALDQQFQLDNNQIASGNTFTGNHAGAVDPTAGTGFFARGQRFYEHNAEQRLIVGTVGSSWAIAAYNMLTMTVRLSDGAVFYIDSASTGVLRRLDFDTAGSLTATTTIFTDVRTRVASDLRGLTLDLSGRLSFASDTQIFALPLP